MRKLNKKEVSGILSYFAAATGLKVEDQKTYFLSSNYGIIKVRFDLASDYMPTVFTKLFKAPELNHRSFNPYSGKRNYHSLDAIYGFINYDIVVDDIVKDDSIKIAKIRKSMFNKDMYDISISNGVEMLEAITCIDYQECLQTALNFDAHCA